jgi:hypothetical protein
MEPVFRSAGGSYWPFSSVSVAHRFGSGRSRADVAGSAAVFGRSRNETLSRHQRAVAQGRDLVEPGSGKMNVSLNCSCHGSWPAVGRIAL